jgi:hypothetical protein
MAAVSETVCCCAFIESENVSTTAPVKEREPLPENPQFPPFRFTESEVISPH